MSPAPAFVASRLTRLLWWSLNWVTFSTISMSGWVFLYSSYSGLNPKSPKRLMVSLIFSPGAAAVPAVSLPPPPQAVAMPSRDAVIKGTAIRRNRGVMGVLRDEESWECLRERSPKTFEQITADCQRGLGNDPCYRESDLRGSRDPRRSALWFTSAVTSRSVRLAAGAADPVARF